MSENRIAASSGKRASGCSVTSVASRGRLRQARGSCRPRARRVVLGQVAPRLAHQPDRRVRVGWRSSARRKMSFFGVGTRKRNGAAQSGKAGRGDRVASARALSFSAAARSCPSGTRRPRARTGGLRGSPRPPATGRGACRRRRTPWAPTSGSSSPCRRLHVAARVAARRRTASSRPSCTGPTKPIASSTRSAGISNSVPGTSTIFIAPSVLFHSTRTAISFSTLPSLPSKLLGRDRQVALAAFFVRRRGAQLDRPVRPDSGLFSCSGGMRQQLELRHRLRAWRFDVPTQSRAGVAAADDHDVLAGGAGSGRATLSPATTLFCCGRNSIAKCTPSRSRPGTGRSRGCSAPPASTTASNSRSSERIAAAVSRRCLADVHARRGSHALGAPSAPCAGRSGASPS